MGKGNKPRLTWRVIEKATGWDNRMMQLGEEFDSLKDAKEYVMKCGRPYAVWIESSRPEGYEQNEIWKYDEEAKEFVRHQELR